MPGSHTVSTSPVDCSHGFAGRYLVVTRALLVTWVLAITGCPSAVAQPGRIVVDRAPLPASVQARIPRGGTSRFYGVFPKFGPHGQDLAVNFYSTPVTSKAILLKNPEAVNCTVNLYATRVAKRPRFRHLKSLHFYNWSSSLAGHGVVCAVGQWLIPAKRQTAVVMFHLQTPGDMGYSINDVLLTFARGLDQPPVVSVFESWGNGYGSVTANFNEVDERGMMVVTTVETEATDDDKPDILKKYYWDGKGFSLRTEKESAAISPRPTAAAGLD